MVTDQRGVWSLKALLSQCTSCWKVQCLEGIDIQMNKNSTCPGKKGHELGLSCQFNLYHSVSYKILKGCPQPGPEASLNMQPPKSTADPKSMTHWAIDFKYPRCYKEPVLPGTQADSQKPPPHLPTWYPITQEVKHCLWSLQNTGVEGEE